MRAERGSALIAALLALALGATIATALAEVARHTIVRGRLQAHATRAWFLAEAGLAETVAAIAPGRSFETDVAVPARSGGSGVWTWGSGLRSAEPADHLIVRVEARGPPPVRRRLEAMVRREHEPFLPGAATLAGSVRELTRDFALDGRDFDMDSRCSHAGGGRTRAGLALAHEGSLPAIDLARNGGLSVRRTRVPDLTPLARAPGAASHPAGVLRGILGDLAAPRFTRVEGDAIVTSPVRGVGLLYVHGRLSIRRAFDFTGVVAAAEGIDISATGSIAVCGALWAGGEPALAVRGTGSVRRSTNAILMASQLAPLPALAQVVATRELFGGTDG